MINPFHENDAMSAPVPKPLGTVWIALSLFFWLAVVFYGGQARPVEFGSPPTVDPVPFNLPDMRVNLNQAARSDLELLPSIGPALAGRIVVDRETEGAFESLDDLQRVKGIGPKTVEKVRAFVFVGSGER